MAYTTAAGHPTLTAVSIPTIYSKKMLRRFYADSCVAQITNTEYEGEIKKFGDTVVIRDRPTVQSIDYAMGDPVNYPYLAPTTVSLTIDKGKLWRFAVDDVGAAQSDIDYISELADEGAKQQIITIGRAFFADIYASAHADNIGTTAGAISGSYDVGVSGNPLEFSTSTAVSIITRLKSILKEQNMPDEGNWVVLPEWAIDKLMNSELRQAYLTGDSQSVLRTGKVGSIRGMDIYSSNLLEQVVDSTAVNATNAVFGNKYAVTFASQMLNVDGPFMLQDTIGHAMRGLQVYGYKAIKPEGLGHLYITPA